MNSTSSLWWQHGPIYQIYPRSFQDSTGDGVGDLRGIRSRLSYFEYLGVNILWLSPVYKSPMVDFGYDVSNFCDIDPVFGTLGDFDDLVADMHSRGMRLMMDFVPNHSSDQHPWFEASKKRHAVYDNYYIWKDAKISDTGEACPPNNWLSVFGGSAWTWCPDRNQYYFHQFYKEQPDLNYRNPDVQKEMTDVLKFWLDRGVDGFRVDAIACLYESDCFQDEPIRKPSIVKSSEEYLTTVKKLTLCRPETYEMIRKWTTFVETYANCSLNNSRKFIVIEIFRDVDVSFKKIMDFYVGEQSIPFNFELLDATLPSKLNPENKLPQSKRIKDAIEGWLSRIPEGKLTCWTVGNHDRQRIASRVGQHLVNAFNTLLLTLPGAPFTYQGEELGLGDVPITFEQVKDPVGLRFGKKRYLEFTRDPCRTPMLWDMQKNAGFTKGKSTWLPISPNYEKICVEAQKDGTEVSPLKVYRELVQLRMLSHDLKFGSYKTVFCDNNLLCYLRKTERGIGTFIVINFANTHVTPSIEFFGCLSENMKISQSSLPVLLMFDSHKNSKDRALRLTLTPDNFVLEKGQAVIFQLV